MRRFLHMALAMTVAAGLLLIPATGAAAAGTRVGYYDTGDGEGDPTQVPPITTAGGTATQLFTLTAGELASVDVLFAQNPSNSGVGSEWLAQLPVVSDWVAGGGVLIFHDRWVADSEADVAAQDSAASILPGGSGITMVRQTDPDDIDVLDPSTLVTNGPGGVLNNTSLDDGNSSQHGYVVASSLPAGAINPLAHGDGGMVLTQTGVDSSGEVSSGSSGSNTLSGPSATATNPNEIVTTCYPFQRGGVIYSTIPLDFYLNGSGNNPPADAMRDIYAPNVVAWGMAGACAGGGGPDGQMTRMYLNTNGAGPGRHTARLEFVNRGPRAGGRVTLAIFLPGTSPSSVQSQQVMLATNQMGAATFMFQKPNNGPATWQSRAYQIRGCIELTGDRTPANNCITQSFSM